MVADVDRGDLIERLRTDAVWALARTAATVRTMGHDCAEAATEIETLRAERDEWTSWAEGLSPSEIEAGYWNREAALRARVGELESDAERWRALMSSQKMHWMGSAGFEHRAKSEGVKGSRKLEDQIAIPKPGEVWHFGMEFWFGVEADPAFPDTFERRLMVDYADAIRARTLSKGAALGAETRDNGDGSPPPQNKS